MTYHLDKYFEQDVGQFVKLVNETLQFSRKANTFQHDNVSMINYASSVAINSQILSNLTS